MTGRDAALVRASRAWVEFYTRHAPVDDEFNRREEVASDVYEQMRSAHAAGLSRDQIARSIAWRTLRGVPDDIAWRIEVERVPGRLTWHADHPSTVLGLSLMVLLPIGLLADALRFGAQGWGTVGLLGLASFVAYLLVCAFGLVAAIRWFARLLVSRPKMTALGLRRFLLCAMSLCWAVSGLWRFVPDPLGVVASVAWMGFGVTLVAYLGAFAWKVVWMGRRRAEQFVLDV